MTTAARWQVAGQTLQSTGDKFVAAATVLPWLFHVLGVPAALTAWLVPIRESGSMLPQALLTPWVVRVRRRRLVVVAGAGVQAASAAVMALAAATLEALTAGIVVLAALAVFSLGRCLCSIATKDVLGRTVPKGRRGRINGLATTASGVVAIVVGLALRVWGGQDLPAWVLALLIGAGALLWVGMAVCYLRLDEPEAAPEPSADREDTAEGGGWFASTAQLLRTDATFRRFVTVRSFLLASALSPPLIVTLSLQAGTGVLAGLGGYVLAAGVAALLGGRIFGGWADRSSRGLMTVGALTASGVILALVALRWSGLLDADAGWLAPVVYVGAYFLLTLIHTGVRVARKTYVVDVATGDTRTTYVAVSNSVMGVVLLIAGGLSSALAAWGVDLALVFLAVLGLLGALGGSRLPDVEKH